jgi:hypothetical protein
MKMFLLGVAAAVAAGLAVGAGVIFSGAADVAADSPHHPLVHDALVTARLRAVARNARDVAVPADLGDQERVRRGAGNYDAMCAGCHLTPGGTDSEIRKGLYPEPPDLTDAPQAAPPDLPAQRFWVIKHGIKSTAMAAWGQGGMSDADLWDLVAFVDALPKMGPGEYRAWVAASEGHSHGGAAADHHDDSASPADPPAATPKTPAPHSHDDGHHDHTH